MRSRDLPGSPYLTYDRRFTTPFSLKQTGLNPYYTTGPVAFVRPTDGTVKLSHHLLETHDPISTTSWYTCIPSRTSRSTGDHFIVNHDTFISLTLSRMSNPTLVGACPVCGLVFYLVHSTGVMHRHGHTASNFPCIGSDQLPFCPRHPIVANISPGILDTAMCSSPCTSCSSYSIF